MGGLSFGLYIIELREKNGISQRKLAEKAGLTNSTISRIEADSVKPDQSTLEKLAKALCVDKSLLLTKCGYSEMPEEVVVVASEVPEDFVAIARKTGELTKEQRATIYRKFNDTIDDFLLKLAEKNGED